MLKWVEALAELEKEYPVIAFEATKTAAGQEVCHMKARLLQTASIQVTKEI